jgi:type IV secretory pathway TraG/TraD family ATPase VirD4
MTDGILGMAALVLVWWFRKWWQQTPVVRTHLRGLQLSEPKPDSTKGPLVLGCRRFPESLASGHMAFVGATGSGKTLLQRLLLQSALPEIGRGRGHRALLYDAKRDLPSMLAGMGLNAPVRILNPLDARAVAWDMAADISNPSLAQQAALLLIPETKHDNNPFFSRAARHLLSGVITSLLLRFPGAWTFRQVLLIARDPDRMEDAINAVESTRYIGRYFEHEATFQNILATLLTFLAPYEILAASWDRCSERISLNQWLAEESILVLGSDDANRVALDTVNRLLFRRLSDLLLSQPEGSARTWIVLDEVREAGRLDGLSSLLTRGRSKGVAVVLGFQDINGLRDVYGREVAEEILGQCNTKVVLRNNSPDTTEWCSKLFGFREVIETTPGSSRNVRGLVPDVSRSASTSTGIVRREVVLDSEILGLPQAGLDEGVTGFFLNPLTGPYRDHVPGEWLKAHLLPRQKAVSDFIPRPDADQFLRPWDENDPANKEVPE